MFDTTTAFEAGSPADWREDLAHGDVVSFRFPVADEDGQPGFRKGAGRACRSALR
jgi:hypothetical protein